MIACIVCLIIAARAVVCFGWGGTLLISKLCFNIYYMLAIHVKDILDIPVSTGAVEVESEDYRVDNHALYTLGASACLVLAAHNSRTRQDLLLHMSEIVPETKDLVFSSHDGFNEAIDQLPELGDPSYTSFWLGGGMPVMEKGKDVVQPNRLFAVKRVRHFLAEYSLPQDRLRVDWSKGNCIDVALYCKLGLLVVGDYPDVE